MQTPPVRIKICGITSLGDAMLAAQAGADALGFVFHSASPRHVGFPQAAEIIAALPPIATVGVFVNPTPAMIAEAIASGIDTLQFHGEETPAFLQSLMLPACSPPRSATPMDGFPSQFPVRTIKAIRVRDESSLEALPSFETDLWLLDSYVPGAMGGTGAVFNWDIIRRAGTLARPIMLAGGLTPGNAAEAVSRIRPAALDVSSGVEKTPGRKDSGKLRDFIAAARSV